MAITYTNRKGTIYTLCQGVTRSGKPRYYFARQPKDTPVARIPDGYEIRESVNGVVSLARIRPALIRPEERAVVEAALKRHPKAHNYRLDVKDKHIVVHERVGMDADELLGALSGHGFGSLFSTAVDRFRADQDQHARFSPVMRFTLLEEDRRTFTTERWCYLGSIDDWIQIGPVGPLGPLAKRFIPLLGSDALFEVLL